MMLLLLLIGGGIALWAGRGRLRGFGTADMLAAIAAIVGLEFVRRGVPIAGIALLGGAAVWGWRRLRRRPAPGLSRAEAHALLDLPAGADSQAIRAAHRRLIARVHPDAGGSTELARRVNQARDLLLARDAPPVDAPGAVHRS